MQNRINAVNTGRWARPPGLVPAGSMLSGAMGGGVQCLNRAWASGEAPCRDLRPEDTVCWSRVKGLEGHCEYMTCSEGSCWASQRRVRSLGASGHGAGSREGSSWQRGVARDGGRQLVAMRQEMLPSEVVAVVDVLNQVKRICSGVEAGE